MYTLKKLDYDRPILVTFVLMILAVGALAVNFTAAIFLLSVALFNFLWIFIDVYQMGGVSVADRSGSAAAFIPGAQGLGQMLGPLAASFLTRLWLGIHFSIRAVRHCFSSRILDLLRDLSIRLQQSRLTRY